MSSIIDVPFSQESWDKGMEYAKTSWAYTYNRRGTSNIVSRLEKIALGVGIGEPSLGSFLKKDKINYNLSGRTKWYQSDIHDFLINDHKTDVKVIFLNENYKHVQNNFLNKKNNDRINHILNNCECLVPADQLNKDIYSFVLAQGKWIRQNENDLFTNNKKKTQNSETIHLFWDYKFIGNNKNKSNPDFDPNGKKLGKLKITKTNSNEHIKFRLYGTSKHETFYSEIVEMKEGEKVKFTEGEFDNVFTCSQLLGEPTKPIQIYSKKVNFSEIINSWTNIKFHCSKISILGFTSLKELQVKSRVVNRYDKETGFYSDTQIPKNLGIRTRDLMSITELKKFTNGK